MDLRFLAFARRLAFDAAHLARFEQRVAFERFADEGLDLEVARREQADRLLQLRRHHQRLGLAEIEPGTEGHC